MNTRGHLGNALLNIINVLLGDLSGFRTYGIEGARLQRFNLTVHV